jgi:excisionase family DNA binding protein
LGNGDFAVDLSPAPLSEKGSRAVARVGAPVTESARERAGVTIPEFERAIEEAPAAELPGLLGELERLRVLAWQQMTARLLAGSRGEPGRFADRLTVTTAEAAEWLGLEESHVQDLCRRGAIPSSKPGKAWLIRVDAIRGWVAQQEEIRHGSAPLGPPPSRRPAARIGALPRNSRADRTMGRE